MKKNLPLLLVIGAGLVVFIVGILFLFKTVKTSKEQGRIGTPEKILEAPEIDNRPYVTLSPRADGRAVTIKISKIPRGAVLNYEITYQTEGVEQGIVGEAILEAGQDIYEREHAFGTCSKNVCKYDKNVEFGKWNAKIDLPNRFYEIGSAWHLKRLSSGKAELENKFTVNIPSGGFSKQAYVITHETQSLPAQLPQGLKLASGPFHFSASDKLNKKSTVSIPITDSQGVKVFFWNGSSWQDLGGELKDGLLSASIDAGGTFVVASQVQ